MDDSAKTTKTPKKTVKPTVKKTLPKTVSKTVTTLAKPKFTLVGQPNPTPGTPEQNTEIRGRGRPPRTAYDENGNYLPPRTPTVTEIKHRNEEIALLESLLAIDDAKNSFLGFCTYALKPYNQTPARHHKVIIEHLEKVCTGDIEKLIIMAPPGSAKSTYTSVLFPAYFMMQNPRTNIIAASNTIKLATQFSRRVRSTVEENSKILGFSLDPDQTAAEGWRSGKPNSSTYMAVGTGGSVLGNRANLFLVDDPYTSRSDAQSATTRQNIFQWFTSDVGSRLSPQARIVVIMTRFHEDDLCGQLLELEKEQWTVIRLPAICDDPDNDPLGRQEGDLLWPEFHDQKFIDDKRRLAGEIEFSTNYQQSPRPDSGSLFDVSKISLVDAAPATIVQTVRAWDIAATTAGDWTVGLKMSKLSDGRYLIEDVVRFRGDPATVEATIKAVASQDGKRVTVKLSIDPGAAGIAYTSYLTRALAGYSIKSEREGGSKEVRATPAASQATAGNMLLMRGRWNSDLIHELSLFPSSKYDDQVDALSSAFSVLCDPPKQFRQMQINWMGR